MAYEMADDTVVLFKNDKGGNDKRPDYRGKAKVGGTEYQASAWIKEPKSGGDKYMSIKLDVPYDAAKIPKKEPNAYAQRDEVPYDDEMPF